MVLETATRLYDNLKLATKLPIFCNMISTSLSEENFTVSVNLSPKENPKLYTQMIVQAKLDDTLEWEILRVVNSPLGWISSLSDFAGIMAITSELSNVLQNVLPDIANEYAIFMKDKSKSNIFEIEEKLNNKSFAIQTCEISDEYDEDGIFVSPEMVVETSFGYMGKVNFKFDMKSAEDGTGSCTPPNTESYADYLKLSGIDSNFQEHMAKYYHRYTERCGEAISLLLPIYKDHVLTTFGTIKVPGVTK